MLFHTGVPWAVGGLVGVDVFFVLSGFLITRLLLDEHARSGRISLGAFWGRRVRRLLPAGLLLVIGTGVLWRLFADPSTWSSLRGDAVSALAYVANWHFAFSGQGYFDHDAPPSPLLHLWSLGVEEQFYLIWPILLVLLLRWRGSGPRRVLLVSVLGVLASTVLCATLYRAGTDTSRLYYGTDTHSAGLLVGAGVASLHAWRHAGAGRHRVLRQRWLLRSLAQLIGLSGLGVLTWAVLTVDGASSWLYRGGFLAVALAVAAVVVAVLIAPRGPLTRLLALPPLAGLGRISYGVYLWHWPVLLLLTSTRVGIAGAPLFALRIAVTLAAALVSWFLLERPLLRRRWSRPKLAGTLVPALVTTVAAAFIVAPIPAGAGERTPDLAALAQLSRLPPPLPEPSNPAIRPARVLVVGDSVALTLGVGFRDVAKSLGVQFYDRGQVGCGIATGGPLRFRDNVGNVPKECDSFPSYWVDPVKSLKPDVVVVMVGRWELVDRYHDGKMRSVGDPIYDDYLRRQLKTGIDALLATGTDVALLTEPCVLPFETSDGSPAREDDPARWRRFDAIMHEGASAYPESRVRLYDDVRDYLCPGGTYLPKAPDGQALRSEDGIHITRAGGVLTGQLVLPKLLDFAQGRAN